MHQRSRLDCGQSEGEFLCLKLQLKFQTIQILEQAIKDEKYFVFAYTSLKLQLKFQTIQILEQAIKDEKYFVFAYTMRARGRRRNMRRSRWSSSHTGRSGRANIASLATTCAPTVDQTRNQGGIASPSTSYLPLKDEIINDVITCHRSSLIRTNKTLWVYPSLA